ncbi:MAG TPA: methyltransferase domain-containing protein [Flavobacteriales bacterium]|nr:methyltransferase domain-containing protein [Flavobacteriales bacterium]
MKNGRDQREIDKTHLSCDQAEERGFLHRDYIAHCLRWSHVVKHLGSRYKSARILDIGCGKETPLIKTLYTMRMTPQAYMGVDMNQLPEQEIHDKIEAKMNYGNFKLLSKFDFSKRLPLMIDNPTVIICFEVLEHVTPKKVLGIIDNIKRLSNHNTVIFISTPCFNGKAAANHINEMTYDFMKNLMSEHFRIEAVWGTFASQRDIEPMIATQDDDLQAAYHGLKDYYDSNLLSVLFAPLFPSKSRNCMWQLTLKI